MSTRRTILSGVIAMTSAGVTSGAATAASTSSGDASNHSGIYPFGDVRRYGLVANNEAAAADNTSALTSLVAPGATFRGSLIFPNTSGSDVYYLNDIVPFRDGIQVDLQGCTLHFKKSGMRTDTNSGFIFAVRDFSIANGSIVVDYQSGGGATSAGNALTFGNRGEDSRFFSPTYDSHLSSPMGNIVVRNLRISSNSEAGGSGILMTGGLHGVIFENIWIDGAHGALDNGIYYEFGWATNEPKRELRQTSHAHNLRFSNINISNLNPRRGAALTLGGAYNCWVDGLYVKSANSVLSCYPGDSSFYRPWSTVDQVGAKRNIAVRNVVGVAITGTAINVGGAWSKSGGYLAGTNNGPGDQVDLIDFSMDGFAIDSATMDGGYGIVSSAEKLDLRNGRITNFSRGIVATHECTRMSVDGVDISGCKQCAMQIGQAPSIYNPPRQKMGVIRNCFIAGNSVGSPGASAAIELDLCAAFIIESNRFGYEPAHDGIAEATQGAAVRVGPQAHNVICRCNHAAGVYGSGIAYVGTAARQGNAIEHASGNLTASGSWEGIRS
jgi:hypothetical protein